MYLESLANLRSRFFTVVYQNSKTLSQEYVLHTFGTSLSFIGGLSAFLWQVVSIVLGSYQTFKYEQNLMSKLYTYQLRY